MTLFAIAPVWLSLAAPVPQTPTYVPSAKAPLGAANYAPQALDPEDAALCRVRFSSSLENDLAVLQDGDLGLILRPGRLRCFYPLRGNVHHVASIPAAGDQEDLLVATDTGLEILHYDPSVIALHKPVNNTVISSSPSGSTNPWTSTRGLWVRDEGGGDLTVYGAEGNNLLVANLVNGTWTDQTPMPLPAPLHDLAWFDYDDNGSDEIAWLFSSALLVQNQSDGAFLVNLPATASDQITALLEAGQPDGLAWTTMVTPPNGPAAPTLGILQSSSIGSGMNLASGSPIALLPIDYSNDLVTGAKNGLEVAAVSGDSAKATIQRRGSAGPEAPSRLYNGNPGGIWADLDGGNTTSVAAAVGDFDSDGRDDIATMDTTGALRLWLGHRNRYLQSYAGYSETNPLPINLPGTDDYTLTIPMIRHTGLAAGSGAQVRLWVRDTGVDGSTDLLVDHQIASVTPDPNGTDPRDVLITLTFTDPLFAFTDAIRVSITPRIESGGVLQSYGVTRYLYWVPDGSGGSTTPEDDIEPMFAHVYTNGPGEGNGTGTSTGGGQNSNPSTPPPGGG